MKLPFSLLLYVLCLLQGCSGTFNTVGDSKFDCNRKQDAKSPNCRSFRAMEASTNGELPDSRFDKKIDIRESDRRLGIAPDETVEKSELKVLPHQVLQEQREQKLDGIPVRLAPVVQRVWIKRHVDGNDSLTEDLIVYKEIMPTRWAGFSKQDQEAMRQQGQYPHKRMIKEVTPVLNNIKPSNAAAQNVFITPGETMAPDPAKSGLNLPE